MEEIMQQNFNNLHSKDAASRYNSFQFIINKTNQPVDWAYDVWDDMLVLMKMGDNHQRTIAVQVLANLAKSDPKQRMLNDLDKLIAVTKDEKFVTARHSLQCLWKTGIVNDKLRAKLITELSNRFKESINEKNCTLIRYDIIIVFRKIFDIIKDEKIKDASITLIQTEQEEKYRKKYSGEWKDIIKDTLKTGIKLKEK